MKTELEAIVSILACQSDKWIQTKLDTTRLALGQRMAELSKETRRLVMMRPEIYAMSDSSQLLEYVAKLVKEAEPKRKNT